MTILIKMETHASDYAPLNAPKNRLNANKKKLLQAVNRMISVFTRVLMTILIFVMAFVQSNVKMTKFFAIMNLFQTDAKKPKIAFPNKKITTETSALTNNVLLNVPKPDIFVREVLMNTDARKKMSAF